VTLWRICGVIMVGQGGYHVCLIVSWGIYFFSSMVTPGVTPGECYHLSCVYQVAHINRLTYLFFYLFIMHLTN